MQDNKGTNRKLQYKLMKAVNFQAELMQDHYE
jgi:hypothetical protein